MGRVYAIEEGTGKRFLCRLECDVDSCKEFIAPNPEISKSGWVKCGGKDETGYHWERYYCPGHAHHVPAGST